jgi:hypothetical protein
MSGCKWSSGSGGCDDSGGVADPPRGSVVGEPPGGVGGLLPPLPVLGGLSGGVGAGLLPPLPVLGGLSGGVGAGFLAPVPDCAGSLSAGVFADGPTLDGPLRFRLAWLTGPGRLLRSTVMVKVPSPRLPSVSVAKHETRVGPSANHVPEGG